MASQVAASERSLAFEWLRQHPNVAETARDRVDVPGKAFPGGRARRRAVEGHTKAGVPGAT